MSIESTRREFSGQPLVEGDVDADPLRQFRRWFDEAEAAGIAMANAMALATATPAGAPSVRMVLLKDADERGFVWYTNLASRKGEELAANPRAALLFYWEALHRQVRLEGEVTVVDAAEANAYFATRPRASNLSAMSSPQSQRVAGRAALEEHVAHVEAAWHGRELERPAGWGGFRLAPSSFEFWQGRPDRLHDRLVYRRGADPSAWLVERLAP